MRILKIVFKTLAWIIGIVLLLLLIIVVAVQIPSVQNKLLGYAIPTIEEMLGGANVEIDHIDLDFFDAAQVDGILIEDLNGDTLVYANQLGIDIGAFSLFGGNIFIDEVTLDGAVINAYQRKQDSAFNFQFILDAFAPADTVVADTSAAAFTVGLRTVDITNTLIRMLDEKAPSNLNVTTDRLLVDIENLDLENQAVDFEDILLEGLRGSFIIDKVDPIQEAAAATVVDTLSAGATMITFPYAGLPISIGELALKDIDFIYKDANLDPVEEGIDPGNMHIKDLNALATGFVWDSTELRLSWDELSFRERSGLTIDQVGFQLAMTPEALDLDEFVFKTDASQVLAKAALDYDSFASLAALDPQTRLLFNFEDSYIALSDLKLLAPTLEEAGLNLDLTANIFADGSVSGTFAKLNLDGLNVRVGQQTAIAASGQIFDALDPEKLSYNLRISRLTSSYRDLKRLTKGVPIPPELADFGQFRFSGSVSGTTTSFTGKNLELRTQGRTGFSGDLAVRNLDSPENMVITADVRSLTTNMEELAGFIPDSLGIDAQALGNIDFQGQFAGTTTDFTIDGTLQSALGSATADLTADFNSDYTDGNYKGSISLDSFNVGRLLQDSTIGSLTLNVELDGSGLSPEAIASNINGTIESFTYLGYTYREVMLNGNLDRQLFRGEFAIDDPNARLSFDGMINLRDSVPDMVFEARIDTLALHPLNLYPTPLGLSMAITANLRGNNADNLVGRALIDSFYLQDSSNVAFLDSLLLRAGDTASGRFIVVTSDLIDASIIGDYRTADLPALLTNYINDFFPIDEYLNPVDKPADLAIEPSPQRVIADQSFDFYFGLQDPVDFAHIFDPALIRLDTLGFAGTFDSREKSMTGQLYIPDLNYDGIKLDTILLDLGGDASGLLLDLRTRGIEVAGQQVDMALANMRLGDDSLQLDLEAYLERDSLLLGTGLNVAQNAEGRYIISMNRDFRVAGQLWKVDRANQIEYWANYLDIQDLTFRKDGQLISIQSDDESQDEDFAPLTVTIENYSLNEITRLVQLEGFSLDGTVDGKLGVRDPAGTMYYTADLTASDIVLNGEPVGTLIVNATSEGLENSVGIDVRLNGPVNDVSIAGEYGINDGSLDMATRIRAFELRVLDPVTVGVLSNSTGLLRADLAITGTVEQPEVNGYMQLDGAATTFDLLGARFSVADSRVDISEDLLDFGTFVIADSTGREATLSGTIAHDYFTDFGFDLNLQTDGFKVLNSEPTLEELYFGDAIVAADIDITGDLNVPVVRGRVSTLSGTDVSIVPLLSVNGVNEESWIIYADPATLYADTTKSLEDVYEANALGLDLGLVINVDDEAVMHVIIDPATGDALRARGNSEMNVQMTPDGAISVTGLYTITEGAYQFTLATGGLNVKQFDFDIQQGSSMQFVGDPLDSRFDITAVYTLETTTWELIKDRTTSPTPSEEASAKRRQTVEVLMSMSGTLEAPTIDLDINLPESTGSGITNTAETVIANLSEQEIYQQVFSLLVFGSFTGGESGGFDPADQGKQIAISSISNLVSNQLNRLADNYIKGVDINIGLESYEDKYTEQQTTTAKIGLSKTLFSDRLTISVGTDVNVGEQSAIAGGSAAGFQSNFVLTYRLTESGHYLVRVFRRPDYDIISSATPYETGAGVSYQRKFD